jgi:hypothetical protein
MNEAVEPTEEENHIIRLLEDRLKEYRQRRHMHEESIAKMERKIADSRKVITCLNKWADETLEALRILDIEGIK